MQQVNLYQAQFKPKHVVLPARQLYLLSLLAIFALIVASFYFSQRNTTLVAQISAQEKQTMLGQQPTPANNLSLLQANLTQLQQQHKHKQILLDYLTNQSFGNKQGFTNNLVHLSKQQIRGVWLTEFSFIEAQNYISLHGSSLQSDKIPLYIDSLAESGPFKGKQFSVFSLQSPADGSNIYTFKLHTSQANVGRP